MKKTIDKYRVLEKLGQGFGGAVFLVESEGKQVALKQLHINEDPWMSEQEKIDNFKREFTVLKKLRHPHILQILDFGFDPKAKFYYFTTEYIKGQEIFEATRTLNYQEIEELFVQILRALSYLHRQKVCHLDLKPQNILVQQTNGQRVAKLIDFGLSDFQKSGMLAGSPGYLAPESLLDNPRDERSDLYSLGVTWYKCLAGKNPFESDSVEQTTAMHRVWMPPSISTQSKLAPPYLDPILEKLLKKNPTERYHRADQVIRDLNWNGKKHYPLETEATALAYLPGEGKLVGRDKEWSQLLSLFNRIFTIRSEIKGCVLLTGEEGTGKSRLLQELRYYSQLHDVPVFSLTDFKPEKMKSNALVIADNADANAISIAARWLHQFQRHSLLIVLSGRHLERSDIGVPIVLRNLDHSQVSEYVSSVLGVESPPQALIDEIFKRTEGNPLLLTELLTILIQSQQIFDQQGRWSSSLLGEIGIDFSHLKQSQTLSDSCERKFQKLSSESQKILSLVALSTIPLSLPMLPHLGVSPSGKDLDDLEREGLIRIQRSTTVVELQNPNYLDWIPKHLDAATLASYHQRLGDYFQAQPELEAAACYHLGFGLGNQAKRFDSLMRYGQSLLSNYEWLKATTLFETAADLAPNLEKKMDTHLQRARAFFRLGRQDQAISILDATRNILKEEKENPERWRWVARTYRELGSICVKAGQFDLARESLQSSRILLEEHGENPVEKILLDNFWASLLMREGKLKEAESLAEKAHKAWEGLPPEDQKQILNSELPSIYLANGKIEQAKELFKKQADYCHEIGNANIEMFALYGLAISSNMLKQQDRAIPVYEACIGLARRLKNEEILFHALNGLGNIASDKGQWKVAAEHYQNALDLAQHHADRDGSIGIAINLARVLTQERDYSSASIYLRHAIDSLESSTNLTLHRLQLLAEAYVNLGSLHAENSRWDEARDAYRDAVKLTRHHPALENFRFDSMAGLIRTDVMLKKDQEAKTLFLELEQSPLTPEQKKDIDKLRPSA